MGRPVNKKNFGATGVDAAPTIPIRFHDGTSLIEGKVVSQRGNGKFLCSNDAGNITRICRLVNKISPSAEFEASIIGIAPGSSPKIIKKVHNRTAVDFDGNRFTWECQDDSTESLMILTAI